MTKNNNDKLREKIILKIDTRKPRDGQIYLVDLKELSPKLAAGESQEEMQLNT